MSVSRSFDQLHVDSDLISRTLYTAFQNVRHAELLSDFEQVIRRAFETLRGSARNYLQISDLRQSREYFFLNTIGKVGVVRIVAQIFEWENGDRFCYNLCRPSLFIWRGIAPHQKQTDGDRPSDDDDINPGATARRFFRQFVRKLRSLDSFRRQFKCPGKN